MPEISYKEFDTHLKGIKKTPAAEQPQVYLFHGEELLYKKAFTSLLEFLIPLDERAVNCDPVDGSPENIRDAVHRANTYSMLSGNKLVAVLESRIFYGKQEKEKFLEKAKDAFQREDMKKAAKYILSLLGQLQLRLEDISTAEDLPILFSGEQGETDAGWVLEVIDFCRESGLSMPSGDRPDQFLEAAVNKGFPIGNYLALTTDLVDKRRALFKCIKEKGMVVDCSVPKGNRRADRMIQEEVLRNRAETILDGSGKNLSPPAFARLYEMTGFDLRTFSNSLEKLVLYVGERANITEEDVTDVLDRSKQDPIYELTGAVSDRDPVAALKLLDSLLQSGLHYLQVHTAIVNQMRKLLLAKHFSQSPYGHGWRTAMPYNAFTDKILPAMRDYDHELAGMLSNWDDQLTPKEAAPPGGRKKPSSKKKRADVKPPSDLLVAANPKNPYPIYLTLKKADNFSMEELTKFYILLAETDMKLKRSARDPKLLLEESIIKICKKR